MTDDVTRDVGSETQNDLAIAENTAPNHRTLAAARARRMRARHRWGIKRVSYDLSRAQLDRLEQLGYLDPFKRGTVGAEQQAFAFFIECELGT